MWQAERSAALLIFGSSFEFLRAEYSPGQAVRTRRLCRTGYWRGWMSPLKYELMYSCLYNQMFRKQAFWGSSSFKFAVYPVKQCWR
jgi:hypothetical protein